VARVRLFLLFVLAAAYFSPGATLSLEWTDEGQIVYPSWRVAEGAIPYRDFGHLYGPSLFLFNGALLRVLGADLLVLRLSLVVLKSITAVLVYACAARVASGPAALFVYALLVVVWGGPWWVFNTPYANHYAVTLILAGLATFLRLRERIAAASLLAGVCFGLAATFKQTSGAFAAAALALFLLRDSQCGGSEHPGRLETRVLPAVRLLRVLVLAGVAVLIAAYLAPQSTLWNAAALSAPAAVLLGVLLAGELRAPAGGHLLRGLSAIGASGIGTALPIAVYAGVYAALGLLPDLWFNMVSGLPQLFEWYTPYPAPAWRALALTVTLTGLLVSVRLWREAPRVVAVTVTAACVLPTAAFLAVDLGSAGGVSAYVRKTAFYGPVLRFFLLLPLLSVSAGLACLLGRARERSDRAAELFLYVATLALLFLYPAADFWHALMILPALLPLLAHQIQRAVCGVGDAAGWNLASRFVPAICFLVLAAPFVHGLWKARAEPGADRTFVRARRITSPDAHFSKVLDLVGEVEAQAAPGQRALLLTNEQMIYFLLGRPSVLEREEFVLYLVGAGLIHPENARVLVPEERIIERLRRDRPLVIDRKNNPAAERFRKTFPQAAAFIAASCPRAGGSGGYDLLDCGG
jgi:hypothetical protein